MPNEAFDLLEAEMQPPSAVARSVALLMADEKRQGQMIYSWAGRYMEAEEGVLLTVVKDICGDMDGDKVIAELQKKAASAGMA